MKLEALCPFGVEGPEPLGGIDGWVMGIREAVWRGHLDEGKGREIYPEGDWSVIETYKDAPRFREA